MNACVPHSPGTEKKPIKKIKINTTLYDLIEAICEEVRAEEEVLVVPTVLDLMKKTCVKLPWKS